MGYARPTDLDAALRLMAQQPWTVLAGGTDLYPATTAPDLAGDVIDINGISSLSGVTRTDRGWRIGASTTWTEILEAPLPPAFHALQLAAREIGSVQIQNAGTIAGNLCNASPAADGVPALLVLDANLELASHAGVRTIALADFLTGPRQTALRPGELVTTILIPRSAVTGISHFRKLGARKYLVISIAMIAARLSIEDGLIRQAALAIGACSATAQRLPELEARLVGQPIRTCADRLDAGSLRAALSPIDDVRGSVEYRLHSASILVKDVLKSLIGKAYEP